MIKESQNYYQIAKNYVIHKQFKEGLSFFQKILEKEPKNAQVMIILGYIHSELEFKEMDMDEVKKLAKKAVDLDNKSPLIWNFAGIINVNKNEYDKAIKCFKRAINLDSDDAEIWYNMGKAYQNKDKINKAIDAYEKATSIDPDLVEAWAELAEFYESKEQEKDAVKCYKKLGSIYSNSNEKNIYDKQIENFKNILALDPYDLETWENMAKVYEKHKEYDKTLVCYEKATELAPYDIDLLIEVGNIYKNKKDYEKAIEFYEKAINIAPDHAIKKNIPIIEVYRTLIDSNPDNIDLWISLGYVFEYKKEISSAIECYERALQIDPNNALARYKWMEAHQKKEA
jgi:tetratricopeptide (TPR) repeat protein